MNHTFKVGDVYKVNSYSDNPKGNTIRITEVSESNIYYEYLETAESGSCHRYGSWAVRMTKVTDPDAKFYMCFVPGRSKGASRIHATLESAETEATRLLNKCGADEVIILKAIKKATRPEPKVDFKDFE